MLKSEMSKTYRVAEMYLYDTCTLSCGYCTLAESGRVLDLSQLQCYKDEHFIEKVAEFYNSRTSTYEKWLVIFTGGEPLIMPNFEYFCDLLFKLNNKVAVYTNLSIDSNHRVFHYLLNKSNSEIDYIMASFHPQAESRVEEFFEKVHALKRAGHSVIFRFVGHPNRLHLLAKLEEKCREIDVCFYPTTLFTKNYPQNYTEKEKRQLLNHFSSISQIIQLNGGLDVSKRNCFAGSRIISIDMRTGDIRPCISVNNPILGNIYKDQLKTFSKPIRCSGSKKVCSCDIHFQQNIVIGIDDAINFQRQKSRFVEYFSNEQNERMVQEKEIKFAFEILNQGNVKNDRVPYYDRKTLYAQYKKTLRKKQIVSSIALYLKRLFRY